MENLLKNATRVLSLQTLRPLGWLSDSVLLAGDVSPIKKPNGKFVYRSVTIDLQSGKRQTQREHPNPRSWGGVLSPDGKWVLENYESNPFELTPRAITRDGKQTREWLLDKENKRIPFPKPLWLSDSKTWVTLAFDSKQIYAVTGTLASLTKAKVIPLGKPSEATGGWLWGADGIAVSHLIANPKEDLIIGIGERRVYSKNSKATTLWRYEFRLSKGARSRREFKIPFPKEEGLEAVAYAPQSQRLALLTVSYPSGWQSLYTMRFDGSQRVCLGTITSRYPLQNLQWLPSGKKLSFEHENALWVLPDAPPARPKLL